MVNNNIYVYTVNNHCLHYYIDDTSHESTRMLTSENPTTIINSEIYYKTCSDYYFLLIGDINGHSWMINAITTALLKKGNKLK